MQHAQIPLAPEGWPVIGLCAFSALVFALLGCWPVAVCFLALTWFCCHFFRDPERVPPEGPGVAASPADGRVVRIERRANPMNGEQCLCVSIFMNVFSVHVNRAPVACTVERVRYWPGKFLNAAWDKASEENERCGYLLRDSDGHCWGMVQIAGLVAQRIVCRVRPGDRLAPGQRYGMIRFGSRVDLYLPEAYTACVAVGDKVYAGQSVLARLKEEPAQYA